MQLNYCIGEAEWIINTSYECARQRKKSELWKRYFASYTLYLSFTPTLIDELCGFILSDSIDCNIESTQNGNQLNKMLSIIFFILLSDNEYNLVKDYSFVNVVLFL